METVDRAEFARAFAILADTFDAQVSSVRIGAYFDALSDLPLEAVLRAMRDATSSLRFFPKPVELRELAGYGAPDAGVVEAALLEHLRSLGGDRRMPDDPFLRLVVERMGGLLTVVDLGIDRPRALAKILPGLVTAARVRGIPMPVEADNRPQVEYRPRIEMREPEIPRGAVSGELVRIGDVAGGVLPKKEKKP